MPVDHNDVEKRRETLANHVGPASLCKCSHAGDCKADDAVRITEEGTACLHDGPQGHGACLVPGCNCIAFRWTGWLPELEKKLGK